MKQLAAFVAVPGRMVLAAGASLKARGGKAPTVGDEAGPVPVKVRRGLQFNDGASAT